MKIYKVIYSSVYIEGGENTVDVKVFLNKDVALKFIKRQIKEIKKEVDDLEDYCVDEKEDFYERYLDGRSMEDSVSKEEGINQLPGFAPEIQGVYLIEQPDGSKKAYGYVLKKEYEM